MDSLQQIKEKFINDYLSNIDLSQEFLNVSQIISDLKSKLGEEPAIKFNYIKEELIKENTGEKITTDKLESMTIIFTVEKEISPGLTAPFPITKTFIVKN